MELLTSAEIGEQWGISSRRVTTLCNEGRIEGASLKGNTWLIPSVALKPDTFKRGRKEEQLVISPKTKMGPFLKWAGGKSQLLERIEKRFPAEFNDYYEPFIGGGAVLLGTRPEKAIINDTNKQLINVYHQLKNKTKEVIYAVRNLDDKECDKDFYLEIRSKYNDKIVKQELDVEMAALMIWINKHCFNGLYRVNSKGLFNVPYNNKTSGRSMDESNIEKIGSYLKENDVTILCEDFEIACENVKENDFVYFDSPYVPISETASFTDYTKDGFTLEDHKRLAKLYRKLDKKGVKLMLSNHNVDLVHELYEGFKIEEVDVKRFINSDATKRTGKEVIITNY